MKVFPTVVKLIFFPILASFEYVVSISKSFPFDVILFITPPGFFSGLTVFAVLVPVLELPALSVTVTLKL